MKAFAALFEAIDASNSNLSKLASLSAFFKTQSAADNAWASYFLAGGKPRQIVPTKLFREAALLASGLSEWLFEESYQAVGDLAETIAHVLPASKGSHDLSLQDWIEQRLIPLRAMAPEKVLEQLQAYWQCLSNSERFVMNKLLTGGFRVGVSKQMVIRALAQSFGLEPNLLAQRMMGYTDSKILPSAERFLALCAPSDAEQAKDDLSPYPFFLAQSLQKSWQDIPDVLGDISGWQAEWKWDGIRAQFVKRAGAYAVWTRGEELATDRYPELAALADRLPDGTVLDGELLVWDHGANQPQSFAQLQTRIARKQVSVKLMKASPVVFLAYDLLQWQGEDWRERGLGERRAQLDAVDVGLDCFKLSEVVSAASWQTLAELRESARARRVEGMMLKRKDAAYGVGRSKQSTLGEWWKWKVDPFSVDCVLIYAQAGHGRRASLYTDYTFAVWHEGKLLPFAKAYSGLTDEEFKQVDAIIKKTTIDKFGPVRSVQPSLVFELGFEGINASSRHKSGVAVRFPRMLRWRQDKRIEEANTLADLKALI